MLEITALRVDYGAAPALCDASLRVAAGELVCVVGPNGAGKTTLINTIAGLLRAASGRMTMDGHDLRTLPRGRNVIREVVRGYGDALVAKSWLVECTAKGCVLHSAICDPPPKARPDNRPHPHPAPPPCDI